MTLTTKLSIVDATIRFFRPDGSRATNQCVGGSANYGGTVKSNRSAYQRKMYSQIKRGLLRLPADAVAELTLVNGAEQYVERFAIVA